MRPTELNATETVKRKAAIVPYARTIAAFVKSG